MRQQEIGEAMAILGEVSVRLQRRETIDVETFCRMIRRSDAPEGSETWKQEMARRLFGEDGFDEVQARMWVLLSRIDPEDFRRKTAALYARIEAALPLDLDSAEAGALVDEWHILAEPVMAIGKPGGTLPPLPAEPVADARARIEAWDRAAKAPCPPKVWEFIFTATRHRMRREM